jgi:hypothetical protein
MSTKLTIAFDVNNTLTDPQMRRLFNSLNRTKCHLIVWSTLGAEYAKDFCQENNLKAHEYCDKQEKHVDIAIDDIPDSIQAASLVLGVKI